MNRNKLYTSIIALCSECGKPCVCRAVDNGIGPLEVHGRKIFDSQMDAESDCCSAPCVEEGSMREISIEDLRNWRFDD